MVSENQQAQLPILQVDMAEVAYDQSIIVKGVSFELLDGEIGCILGPSGCGKSTLLRTIAGFEPLVNGSISMAGKLISSASLTIAPEDRKIGLVFQDLALFPHLTVAENISFGINKWSKTDQMNRISQLLDLVGMKGMENRYPDSLSGGQQQRIAIARAIAPKPKIILLDEPFSGLDASMREELIPDVRSILKHEQISAILVTHDQLEAFAVADKMGVMSEGRILQFGKPFNIYHEPKSRFIANFIGKGKFIPATVIDEKTVDCELGILKTDKSHQLNKNQVVDMLIRPDDVIHNDDSTTLAKIINKQFQGSHFLYLLELDRGSTVYCYASSHHNHSVGEKIGINLEMEHLVLF